MNTRALLALVFCSFTIAAAGCGSMDEAQTAPSDLSAAADSTEIQSFAQRKAEKPKCAGKKPPNLGQPCGCGNTFQCDGTCGGGPAIPADFGQACGCGNTVQCNGTCGGGAAIPADFGQSCGCGNTVQCNGTCSGGDAIPADFNQPCGCGGRVECNGTCSIPCPV